MACKRFTFTFDEKLRDELQQFVEQDGNYTTMAKEINKAVSLYLNNIKGNVVHSTAQLTAPQNKAEPKEVVQAAKQQTESKKAKVTAKLGKLGDI